MTGIVKDPDHRDRSRHFPPEPASSAGAPRTDAHCGPRVPTTTMQRAAHRSTSTVSSMNTSGVMMCLDRRDGFSSAPSRLSGRRDRNSSGASCDGTGSWRSRRSVRHVHHDRDKRWPRDCAARSGSHDSLTEYPAGFRSGSKTTLSITKWSRVDFAPVGRRGREYATRRRLTGRDWQHC